MNIESKIDFAIGGQALIEGVMMKSPSHVAMAVRKKDNSIKLKDFPFLSLTSKNRILKLPLIRGIINLFEMAALGIRALNFSAEEFAKDDEGGEKAPAQKQVPEKNLNKNRLFSILAMTFSFVLSFALTIFLFKFIPLAITEYLRKIFPFIAAHYIVFNLIDGLLRIAIFTLYIFILSLFKSFYRIFEYHGAEHMTVYTYEKGLPLTVENARNQSRLHPRCGTSFLLVTFLISIAIFSLIPRNPIFWLNLLQRIAALPLIAAVGYEILKWSSRHMTNPFVKIIVLPGLLTQKITTKTPDDSQLEVALKALSRALELEKM